MNQQFASFGVELGGTGGPHSIGANRRTTGRGKKSTSHKLLIPAKDIWLYPLRKNFATLLCK